MKFCRLISGDDFDNRLYSKKVAMSFPYVATPPEPGEGEVVVTRGFQWLVVGESATGIYEVVKQKPRPKPVADRYYSVDVLSAIGRVCGEERYDKIKEALAMARIEGTPVWDMMIAGMFIPANDPRLAMIRTSLVGAGLVTDAEFDNILALAASDEPVAEAGATE